MTAAKKESNNSIVDELWLNQSSTQQMLARLNQLRQEKLTTASRAAANPSINDLMLRLLLREASVIEEIINEINPPK